MFFVIKRRLLPLVAVTISLLWLVAAVPYQKPVVVGYYPDWTTSSLPPAKIPFSKLTHINYAFATVSESAEIKLETTSTLTEVVSLAHKQGVKVLVSVGGWTGSRYFSPVAASADKRSAFVKQCVDLVKKYHLDGIDIDWEFPGRVGMSCNVYNEQEDTPNFYKMLQELRGAFDNVNKKLQITLAVRISPFDGPLKDLKDFSKTVDFINIMAYDINGVWSDKSGPNAPLTSSDAQSVEGSATAWMNAGWPREKITMGVAFYGRTVTLTQEPASGSSSLFGLSISKTAPKGDSDDAPWAEPCPGSPSVFSGIWKWGTLRKDVLKTPTTAAPGWQCGVDAKSQTPWLYNESDKSLVSYEDPISIHKKVQLAMCKLKLHGIMAWDLHQDNGELIDAVTDGLKGC